jgi:hypothetical protein
MSEVSESFLLAEVALMILVSQDMRWTNKLFIRVDQSGQYDYSVSQ